MSINKNIFKISRNVLIIPVLLFITFCGRNEEIIATVGSHDITLSDFQNRYEEFLQSTGVKDNLKMRKDILDNMINEIILFYYDDNTKIFNNPTYQKEEQWLAKEAVLSFVKDRDIYAKISATDEEIRSAYYKAHVSLSARHLFAHTKEEADNLYELLKAGADFNTLAKQVFTDSTLRANGGYLGYFTWGDMDPAFEEAAYKLKPGEISKPVQTARGYSIIKLEDRKVIPLMTEYDYGQRKKGLERSLRISKKGSAEKAFIAKLFDVNKLRFNDEGIDLLFNALFKKDLSSENSNAQSTVCEYNGRKFSLAEIYKKLMSIPDYHLTKIDSKRFLKKAVQGILIQDKIYDYAIEKGYNKNKLVIETQHKLKMNKFLQDKMKEIALNSEVSDSAVIKYYEENISLFSEPRKINVREIIVKRKALADSLIHLLANGTDFGSLAKKFSLRRWSAENGGLLGLSPLDQFGIIKDKLWNSPVGKISGAYEIQNVFGIFEVVNKIEKHPIPFDKIQNQVKEKLKLEQRTKLVSEYLDKKRKEIAIKIYTSKIRFSKNEI